MSLLDLEYGEKAEWTIYTFMVVLNPFEFLVLNCHAYKSKYIVLNACSQDGIPVYHQAS